MLQRSALKAAILAAGITPFLAGHAGAQSDILRIVHVASANRLGVLEYCQAQGFTDQAAVDIQRKEMAAFPASNDADAMRDAESNGRSGNFLANGKLTSLEAMAASQSTSVYSFCGQLGDDVKRAAAQTQAIEAPATSTPQRHR